MIGFSDREGAASTAGEAASAASDLTATPCHLPQRGRLLRLWLHGSVRPEAEPYRMYHTSDRAHCRARPPGRANALSDREGAASAAGEAASVASDLTATPCHLPRGGRLLRLWLHGSVRPEAEPYRMCHTSDRAHCRARPPGRAVTLRSALCRNQRSKRKIGGTVRRPCPTRTDLTLKT